MRNRSLIIAITVFAVLLLTTGAAWAWPDQPPDEATISGPGLTGEMHITNPNLLQALRLGSMEDFSRGILSAPPENLGEGYRITRYFDGGKFNFATLEYYPNPAGGPGYLYFEDGPDLQGNHTEYNGQWLYATPAGEAALQTFLASIPAPAQAPAPASVKAPAPINWPVVLAVSLGGLLALSGILLQLRPKPAQI